MNVRKLVLVLAAAGMLTAQTAEADVLLQRAIRRETVEGDLTGAIEMYKKVIAGAGKNRLAAAKALLRLGDCYEKQGNAEARKMYERVIREYADQTATVREARARLGKDQPEESSTTARQVWSGADRDMKGRPSPDGRYFAFRKPAGSLAIRDLITGTERLLSRDVKEDHTHGSAFSPDGKRIAYFWCHHGELRIINTDGSDDRVVRSNVQGEPAAWSPDSRYIAARIRNASDNNYQVALISTADGSVRALKTVDLLFPEVGDFSPDGRFLVYAVDGTEKRSGGVFTLATDGSGENALVQGPSVFRTPAWTPNGGAVVFASNRSGTTGLWAMRVTGGRPVGSPQLVKAEVGNIVPMTFTRDGSYFYGVHNSSSDVYLADFDPKELRLSSEPRRLTGWGSSENTGPAWSPDGSRIAFVRTPAGNRLSSVAVIHSLADGKERVLPKEFSGWIAYHGLHWLGVNSLLVPENETTMDRNKTFWRFDVNSGEAQPLMDRREFIWSIIALSPDTKTMFYSLESPPKSDGPKPRLVRRDLGTGAETTLYEADGPFWALAAAPDGRHISFIRNFGSQRALYIMPAGGGAPREIYRGTARDMWHIRTTWTRDGRHVIARAESDTTRYWKAFSVEGGEPVIIDPNLRVHMLQHPAFSPDGRRIAFSAGTQTQDVWVIKNLLPDAQAAR